jgi:hypothetical protein
MPAMPGSKVHLLFTNEGMKHHILAPLAFNADILQGMSHGISASKSPKAVVHLYLVTCPVEPLGDASTLVGALDSNQKLASLILLKQVIGFVVDSIYRIEPYYRFTAVLYHVPYRLG